MQLCPLGQGTVSKWSIVPRCPSVLQVLPTMSDSWDCESWYTWELSDTVGSTCNTLPLGQRETMLNGDTVPCPNEQGCIVWTGLYLSISGDILNPFGTVIIEDILFLQIYFGDCPCKSHLACASVQSTTATCMDSRRAPSLFEHKRGGDLPVIPLS